MSPPGATARRPIRTWQGFTGALTDRAQGNAEIQLHTERDGAGIGVVMLHGLGASSYSWQQLNAARPANRETIRFDLKGHGRSPKPIDYGYGIYDHAFHIVTNIERLGIQELVLVGHSLGGGCALLTTLALKQFTDIKVLQLVLIGSVGIRQPVPLIFHGVKLPVLPELCRMLLPATWISKAALRYCYSDPGRITAAQIRAYAEPAREAAQRLAVIRSARYIEPLDLDDLVTRYHAIDCPSLLLWGEDDRLVPPAIGQRLAAILPNAQYEVLSQCGHIPQEEQPEKCAERVWRFLAA